MKYYVVHIESYDGGGVEVFDDEQSAREFVKKHGGDLNYIIKGSMIFEE